MLFTNAYPYGYGESFLETEIRYLSDGFKQVIILPFRMRSHIRELPDNVSVDDVLTKETTILIFLKYFLPTLRNKEFKKTLRNININKGILNIIKIVLFYCKSLYIKNRVECLVGKKQLKYENVLFYTYWLTSGTFAISLIKRNNINVKLASRAHRYDLYGERHLTGFIPMQRETILALDKLYLISIVDPKN